MLCIPQVLRGISLCPGICVSDKSTSNFETQNEATAHPENWPVKRSKPPRLGEQMAQLAIACLQQLAKGVIFDRGELRRGRGL